MSSSLKTFNPRALERLNIPGDEAFDLVEELTRTLLATAEDRIQRIRGLAEAGQAKEAAVEVHNLKSAVRTMGAERMGELCLELEEMLNSEPTLKECLNSCDEILLEYREFAAELAVFTGIRLPDPTA